MEIRYVTKTDSLLEISNVYECSWKYVYRNIVPQHYLDRIPVGQWAGRINRPSLILLDRGKIAGTASFCQSRWKAYGDYGEVVSLYLLPDYMGKGYGGPLLERCVEELGRRGFRKVLLWVLADNRRARKFYEKHGFTSSEVSMDTDIGGKTVREVLYLLH